MKTYKIKIHKHTLKRYRESMWYIDTSQYEGTDFLWSGEGLNIVTDLTKKPKGSIADEYKQITDIGLRNR